MEILSYLPYFLAFYTLFSGVMWLIERFYLRRLSDHSATATTRSWWWEYTAGLFPILFVVFFVRSFVVEPFRIPSSSMRPGLEPGDLVVVNKFSYGVRVPLTNRRVWGDGAPNRGDVAVFKYPPNPRLDYIKRVVGVAGDTIRYKDKKIWVNDVALTYSELAAYSYPEDQSQQVIELSQKTEVMGVKEHRILVFDPVPPLLADPDNFPFRENCQYDSAGFTCKVPAGHYFVMGDNRDNSADSRYWGFVPDSNVVGKAFYIWMNFSSPSRIGAIE